MTGGILDTILNIWVFFFIGLLLFLFFKGDSADKK